jgi:hypothetical protein
MLKKLYNYLSTPEKNGKTIGLFRTITSLFGGLIVSYLGMTLLAVIVPLKIQDSTIISIFFNTLAWAMVTIYIALSYTKLSALLKFLIPTIIFTISLLFYTKAY